MHNTRRLQPSHSTSSDDLLPPRQTSPLRRCRDHSFNTNTTLHNSDVSLSAVRKGRRPQSLHGSFDTSFRINNGMKKTATTAPATHLSSAICMPIVIRGFTIFVVLCCLGNIVYQGSFLIETSPVVSAHASKPTPAKKAGPVVRAHESDMAPQVIVAGAKNSTTEQTALSTHRLPVVDIISIGSIQKEELQEAQRRTFATHPSVRHFYRKSLRHTTSTPRYSLCLSFNPLKQYDIHFNTYSYQ